MKKSGIYKITNVINNKIYIGSAIDFQKRWNEHINELKSNKHYNDKLQNAWNKYGESAFKFSIIEEVCKSELLLIREQYCLDIFQPFGENGYNICKQAGSTLGVFPSIETRQKMSLKQSGVNNPAAILDEEKVLEIKKKLAKNDKSMHSIAKEYNISRGTVEGIKRGKIWKNVIFEIPKDIPWRNKGEKHKMSKLKEIDVWNIRKLIKEGNLNFTQISKLFNVKPNLISKINANRVWKHLK